MRTIVIAGVESSVGKTTICTAIMRAFTNSGDDVAPFKVGPDYIDPKFHTFVTGNNSYNLDSWMMDEETVKYLFYKNSLGKNIAVIEGVMGLYDGQGIDSIGSTAHVAKILGAPVILVINAWCISESIAAMILGYRDYDKDVNLKGVILNNISSKSHYQSLLNVIKRDTGVECLGYMPKQDDFKLESRHLGLVPVEELKNLEKKVDLLAEDAARYIDIPGIEEIAQEKNEDFISNIKLPDGKIGEGLKIAVARDEAFNFYYQDNLDLMKEVGIELLEFSPLHDNKLPENIDGIYIGGGFPEVFAEDLSLNSLMLEDINSKASKNMPVYAECGGLMYLATGIVDSDFNYYRMIDFFRCKAVMTDRLQRFGYVEIEYDGIKTRGHEFHHSFLDEIMDDEITYTFIVKNNRKNKMWNCGLSKKNVLAGYAHIHFYSNLKFFEKIVNNFKK